MDKKTYCLHFNREKTNDALILKYFENEKNKNGLIKLLLVKYYCEKGLLYRKQLNQKALLKYLK